MCIQKEEGPSVGILRVLRNFANVRWQLYYISDNVGVRSLVKGVLGPEESWVVVQAKRRRDREDVYKKNPGLDPVFMKI